MVTDEENQCVIIRFAHRRVNILEFILTHSIRDSGESGAGTAPFCAFVPLSG